MPLLNDENDGVQISSAEAVGQIIDIVGNSQIATDVAEALQVLIESDNDNVWGSAFSASAHARSWLDIQSLLSQLQDPEDSEERTVAAEALFLAALRDQAQLRIIKRELESLREDHRPFVRIAANWTLEMLNIAALVHSVEDSTSLSKTQSYLRELVPDIPFYTNYYDPYIYYQADWGLSTSGHIRFAVREALAKLDQLEGVQSKDK